MPREFTVNVYADIEDEFEQQNDLTVLFLLVVSEASMGGSPRLPMKQWPRRGKRAYRRSRRYPNQPQSDFRQWISPITPSCGAMVTKRKMKPAGVGSTRCASK